MFISLPKLLYILLQFFARRVRGDLDKMSIRSRKVRVPSVGHGPVEEAVHLVDVHVEVLRRLDDEVDVPLMCSSL